MADKLVEKIIIFEQLLFCIQYHCCIIINIMARILPEYVAVVVIINVFTYYNNLYFIES